MIDNKISKRESIVLALAEDIARLEASLIKVYRNLDKPHKIPVGGLIIIRDNEAAKEVETLLNPLSYVFELTIQIEIIAQHLDANTRSQILDELYLKIEKIISINRDLNKLAEWVEVKPVEFQDEPIEGAATIRAAIVPVTVRFSQSVNCR